MYLTPPRSAPESLKRPLPRPPAWTWALSTTGLPPNRSKAAAASAGEAATMPRGIGAPAAASSSFAWNSWIFMAVAVVRVRMGNSVQALYGAGGGAARRRAGLFRPDNWRNWVVFSVFRCHCCQTAGRDHVLHRQDHPKTPAFSDRATEEHAMISRRRRGVRARLERLEDRLAPAFTVNTLVDENNGIAVGGVSLREAITEANANGTGLDTIDFSVSVTGTINLTGALPNLDTDLTIDGPGANLLTVRRDTGGDYSLFKVPAGRTVTLQDLTLANGGGHINGGG